MRAPSLLPLLLVACSIDWSLARRAPTDTSSGGAGGTPAVVENALVLCQRVVALPSTPLIDGQLEPNLTLHPWFEAGSTEVPAGIQVRVTLAHRPDGLYFFADVEDPTRDPAPQDALTYCGDGLELFVDDDGMVQNPPGYDLPGTMQLIIAAPGDDMTPARRGQRFVFPGTSSDSTDLGDWASGNFIAVPTTRGYAIEAFVVASDLDLATWALAPGAQIGWNMSLNIGGPQDPGIDACTTRSQQVHFHLASSGSCTAPYCNASALCAPTLSEP
jgi:hypothetical protein